MATKRKNFWVALLSFPIIGLVLHLYLKSESPRKITTVPYTAVLIVNNRTLYHVKEVALYEAGSNRKKLLVVQELFVPSHSVLPMITTLDCKYYDILLSFEGKKEQFFEKVDICRQEIKPTKKGFREKNSSHE